MKSAFLPKVLFPGSAPPSSGQNMLVYAHSTDKYYYPEHKTPYLFLTNSINPGQYLLNRKNITISDNYFYFANPNDNLEIRFSKVQPLQTLLILFDQQFVSEVVACHTSSDDQLLESASGHSKYNLYIPSVPFKMNKTIMGTIRLLLDIPDLDETFNTLLNELLFGFMLLHRETELKIKSIQAAKYSTQQELYQRVFHAKEFLHDHTCENVTLEKIARQVCLNKFHLLSNFKQVFQKTPHQYQIELKLMKAHDLLKAKKHSVTEVCMMIGFESLGSFSNLFKRRFKISPSSLFLKK